MDIVVAIIGLIGTLAGGLVVWLTTRHKNRSDAAGAIADAAVALVQPLQERIERLETRVKTQERDVKRLNGLLVRYADRVIVLMRGIESLIKQIGDLGGKPCWEPPEWVMEELPSSESEPE